MKNKPPFERYGFTLPPEIIETERLILRDTDISDAPAFHEMDLNPNVMRYIPVETNPDLGEYTAEMKALLAPEGRMRGFKTVIEKDTGLTLGWLLLRPTEDGEWMELGYRIIESHWGKGIMTEAATAIMDLAFNTIGYDEVMAIAMPDNAPSIAIMKKMGMEYRGTEEFMGCEVVFYSVSKTSWMALVKS